MAQDMLPTRKDIQVGPLSVRAGRPELREFATALGLASETIPLTFPIRWMILPLIRKAIEDQIGPNPVHLSQSFEYFDTLAADHDYHLTVSLRSAEGTPQRLLMRGSLTDRHDRRVLQCDTVLLPTSAISRPSAAPSVEPGRDQLPGIVFGPFEQSQIDRYAHAAGDDSRLHHDPEFIRSIGLDRPIIHGMLIMGLFQKALEEWQMPAPVVRLFALFARPVPVGNRLHVAGRMTVAGGGTTGKRQVVRLLVGNDGKDVSCIGEAVLAPSRSGSA